MEKPWKVVAAFVAVFIAGSVFGGFFALRPARQVAEQQRMAAVKPAPFNPPAGPQLLRRFADRLELTEEQRAKLRPVVDHAEDQIGRIRQASLEQTETVLRRMQQEFRAELDPEQIRALDRMQRIQNENLRREREQRPRGENFGPDGPPGRPMRPGPNRPFVPNRPFNPRNEGPRGSQDQPGPYGPPSREFEGPPPGPRPEFPRGVPGQAAGERPMPPGERAPGGDTKAEAGPRPGP